MDTHIREVFGRELLDSRGRPTVEADVLLAGGARGRAMVPSGASTGAHEALELRDGDPKRYQGKGTLQAVANILEKIGPALRGLDAADQAGVDGRLIELDGTPSKSSLGANAILAVSLANVRASADAHRVSVFRELAPTGTFTLPVPLLNILNGGVHAHWESTDFQEFMVVPLGAESFREALRWGAEIYQALREILQELGLPTLVGDEGGFAPSLATNREAVELILRAIERSGHRIGEEVGVALDPAASELYDEAKETYRLRREGREYSSQELIAFWDDWIGRYPILSIEDGLAQDDWANWVRWNQAMGERVQLVGDDLLVTNPNRVRRAMELGACNALLVKVNQIGTLSETRQAIDLARSSRWGLIASHRSGETEDSLLADLAVGLGMSQIKAGAPARSERVAKYNRLLRIEEELGADAKFAGGGAFRR
ncbi:MAG: phosphopyruvate hydratase [Anaerolineales bacterium]